jgi:hypothetical protein
MSWPRRLIDLKVREQASGMLDGWTFVSFSRMAGWLAGMRACTQHKEKQARTLDDLADGGPDHIITRPSLLLKFSSFFLPLMKMNKDEKNATQTEQTHVVVAWNPGPLL